MSGARPDPRDFRRRLLAREPLIGTFMKFPGPHATEIIGSLGFDFVMLIGVLETLAQLIRFCIIHTSGGRDGNDYHSTLP